MVVETPNCFTIQAGEPMAQGIPLSQGILLSRIGGVPFVYIGGDVGIWTGERHGSTNLPDRNATHLLRARTKFERGRRSCPRLVASSPESTSLLLYIVANELRFDVEPYSEGLNLWPGGDGDVRPFMQYGEHKNGIDKVQLFELREGESIFVVDQRRALAQVTCTHGQPVVTQPSVSELVHFLCSRAEAQRKVQAIDWALHNLRALAKSGHRTIVQGAITELELLRAKAN